MITLAPFVLGLLTSFTSAHQFATGTPLSTAAAPRRWPTTPAWPTPGSAARSAVTALMTAVILLGQLTFSVLAAYAFARLQFPGRDALFWVYIATLMVPGDRHGGAAVSDDGPARSAQHVLGVGAAVHVRFAVRDLPAARALSHDPRRPDQRRAPRRRQHPGRASCTW